MYYMYLQYELKLMVNDILISTLDVISRQFEYLQNFI